MNPCAPPFNPYPPHCGPWPWAPVIAKPARKPHYIIPGSHWLDPPYSWKTPWFPFPRPPRAFETESRAPGTGLIWGGPRCPPRRPCGCNW